VESPDSFLETTKEIGERLVESPGKQAYQRYVVEEGRLSVPRQRRQNVIARFVGKVK
jgi:hypothetical protein